MPRDTRNASRRLRVPVSPLTEPVRLAALGAATCLGCWNLWLTLLGGFPGPVRVHKR